MLLPGSHSMSTAFCTESVPFLGLGPKSLPGFHPCPPLLDLVLDLVPFSPYCSTLTGAFCPSNLPFYAHLKAWSALVYPPPGPTLAAS